MVAVLLVGGIGDTLLNWNKAFGNVFIGNVDVGGMNAEQMREALAREYETRLDNDKVLIYASEEVKEQEESNDNRVTSEERRALAEQISVEDAQASVTTWETNAQDLNASLPYDAAIQKALEAGRAGGPFSRFGLFFVRTDVPFDVQLDSGKVEELAADIDKTIGDMRRDASVVIEDGVAKPVEGHDGYMVDRAWLSGALSTALLDETQPSTITAAAKAAPSRISYDDAQRVSDGVNRAVLADVTFKYQGQTWKPDADEIASWTNVNVEEKDDGTYELVASIDKTAATSAVVKNVDANVTSDDLTVTFEKSGDDFLVHTAGSGNIPEVTPAVEELNEKLYGPSGVAWSTGASGEAVELEILESNAPETLTFEQAVDLGIITVIGEYTTEFSNIEGTEHRNHNIKTAADLIGNSVVKANGGTWDFNEISGDTNLDPPFESAGSIIDGEYVDSIGGGICQVATTVFNAVYEAGLTIDERHNHTLYIASYPTGRDAAVSYPEMTLKWSNPLPSDVLLKTSYTDDSITVKLYSVYTGYKVESQEGAFEPGQKYSTRFETDNDLGPGMSYLKTAGHDGSKTSVTRTVYDKNGNYVSSNVYSSVYLPKDAVYVVGPGTDTSALTG